jgi:phospholipase C
MRLAVIVLLLAGCGDDNGAPQTDGGAQPDATGAQPDLAQPADLAQPPDLAPACPSAPWSDVHAAERQACAFAAGARVADTLGVTPAMGAAIPLTHLVILTQENRSFDHYFGSLAGVEGWPAGFTNPDGAGKPVAPYHLPSSCLPQDPPHQGAAMMAGWDHGAMDGFVKSAAINGSDGHYALGYYDASDLPFYYWLAGTFAIADHYFSPALGGTWANRDFLYAGTSDGVRDTGERAITVPTIFDALDAAHVTWGSFSDGDPRQDCLGWTKTHAGVAGYTAFKNALANGTLPAVSFLDPGPGQDEHPTAEIHGGERWMSEIYATAIASPLWPTLAIVFTYDESGGLADHVPPPAACPPSAAQASFDNYGMRIPAIVISPWARPKYVSHAVHDHTSVLRLIELLHDLPALTARDANADALLDLFDFACPAAQLPAAPAPGFGICL